MDPDEEIWSPLLFDSSLSSPSSSRGEGRREKTSLELVFVADHSSDEREKREGRGSYIEECALEQQFSSYLSSLPVDDWKILELVSGPTAVQLIGSDGYFGGPFHPKNELVCDNRSAGEG